MPPDKSIFKNVHNSDRCFFPPDFRHEYFTNFKSWHITVTYISYSNEILATAIKISCNVFWEHILELDISFKHC